MRAHHCAAPCDGAGRAAAHRNTCHVWAKDGEHIARIVEGSVSEPPIPISVRIRERGGDPDEWRRQRWD
jgi:hypothetical protein